MQQYKRHRGAQHATQDPDQQQGRSHRAAAARRQQGPQHDDDADDILERAQADSRNVYMACTHVGCQLGVAVYDRMTNEISLMQAHDEVTGPFAFQMLQYAKLQTEPDVVFISSKIDGPFLEACKQATAGSQEPQYTVLQERQSLFTPDKAMQMMSILHVRGSPSFSSRREHLSYLSTLVDLGKELQVAALGALLAVLQKEGVLCLSEQDSTGNASMLAVDGLAEFTLQGHLMLDSATMQGLNIFSEERHPSHMGIGSTKEGFSLFGMLNKCITNMGRRLMRLWFLRPLVNLEVLSDRHDTIELLMPAPELMKTLRDVMAKVRDVPKLLAKLQLMQGRPELATFRQLQDSLSHLLVLRDMFSSLAPRVAEQSEDGAAQGASASMEGLSDMSGAGGHHADDGDDAAAAKLRWSSVNITRKILAYITEELYAGYSMIGDVIDFSCEQEGMLVQQGVCQELDDLKATYHALPDYLTQLVEEQLTRIPSSVARASAQQLWSIIYMPQVGYVMQVSGQQLGQDVLECLPDYQLAFDGHCEDGYSAYYQSECTSQLNHRFGDMMYKIQDLEASLCTELIKRILQHSPQLHKAAAAVAELDCLVAFAMCAREYKYCRPQLTTDNVLHIVNGRHPLAEVVVDTFIPNDTLMQADQARVHVITGPNASGKSCYTKQVALIVYLAHVGCFVPADEATVGLADRIITRIVSQERLVMQQSTFMIDLTQVATMLRRATSRSLVIIDEFGKGTLTFDGVGLLGSVLHHFSHMEEPPRVLACTHFNELYDQRFLPRSPQLQFHTMEVMTTEAGGEQAQQQQVFLYKLVQGRSGPSFGVFCARLCGVPAQVLQRAQEVIELQERGSSVQRLALRSLRQRDQRYMELAQQLVATQLEDGEQVAGLVKAVTTAEDAVVQPA